MFERSRIDNATQTQGTAGVPVEVTLSDGETLGGKMMIAQGRSVFDLLNGPAMFVEFEPYGGERQFFAKSAIRGVKLTPVPGNAHLQGRLREVDGFDPHMTLGVARDAAWEDVRAAYHKLAMIYHPDRTQSLGLPKEVNEYMAAMARRVNVAYAALEKGFAAQKAAQARPASRQSTPIYTSGPR